MPDEHSTIEQLLDEAMPILDAACDFPERDLTFEERGYTGSVLNYILRWDNPEWRRSRGLLFETLPDDPPLIRAAKATVLAIDDHLQPPRNKNPDRVRRSAALALAEIASFRNPVPVEPPPPAPPAPELEPSVGMFPASMFPISRDVPAPALQLRSPWREWADAFREPQQDARRARTAEEQDGIRGPRAIAREHRPPNELTRYKAKTDFSFFMGVTNWHVREGDEIWWNPADNMVRHTGHVFYAPLMDRWLEGRMELWPAGVDHPYEKPRTSWQHILNDEGIGDDP